ncbi:hypothetical protein U9M48_043674 [Paspalum notatum var. saurae]|uniref:Uncharacterized protein n=1 Tax=Paspalum notatum var. saurae TaxID=547442 RepID=A0AAQ3UTY9_PASNO
MPSPDNEPHWSRAAFADTRRCAARLRGTVLFVCKNGEHRSFTGVYYIPRLTANRESRPKEADYDIHLRRGGMEIREPGGRLTRVPRADNRLYRLDVKVAQPVCLAARGGRVPGGGTPGLATSTCRR